MEKLPQIYMQKLQIAINISTFPHATYIIEKEGIPYNQALRLNRISSDPISFDRR